MGLDRRGPLVEVSDAALADTLTNVSLNESVSEIIKAFKQIYESPKISK